VWDMPMVAWDDGRLQALLRMELHRVRLIRAL
jgi:hypothetical protein